jgi:hypothetical protein
MMTSSVLWCVGDYMAQSIEHYEATTYGPNKSGSSSSKHTQGVEHAAQQGSQSAPQQLPQQQQQQQQLASAQGAAQLDVRGHQQQQAGSSSSNSSNSNSSSSSSFTLDTRRLMLTSAFGAGFIGPVGHLW